MLQRSSGSAIPTIILNHNFNSVSFEMHSSMSMRKSSSSRGGCYISREGGCSVKELKREAVHIVGALKIMAISVGISIIPPYS